MDLRIFTEPQQGASYDDLLAVALCAEECGYGAFFRSDHYMRMGPGDPRPGPTDAWTTLAGLARDTTRIRLGTLLSAATFRLPGQLAVVVAQVDQMSGGRVELGLGAGWFAEEHRAFGIPFPEPASERFERLEEQLEIVTGLWATEAREHFDFEGRHYLLSANPGLPKPAQAPRPPVILGGRGLKRTPELAARFGDECNVPFSDPDRTRRVFSAVDEACERIDRDPATVVRSVALVVCCGANEAEVTRRAGAIGRDATELRANGAAGTPAEVLERLAVFAAAGAGRVYLQFLDLSDLDHLRLVADEVVPALKGAA